MRTITFSIILSLINTGFVYPQNLEGFYDALKEPEKITSMNLSDAKLDSLPYRIGLFYNLEYLNLNNNNLSNLPETIKNLRRLKDLDLSKNKFKNLQKEIFLLDSLVGLDLSEDTLLPWGEVLLQLSQFKNLEILQLQSSNIYGLPKEFSIRKLRILDIRDNRILELPKKMIGMDSLESFSITIFPDTDYKNVFEIIGKMPNLRSINLSFEKDANIGYCFEKLGSMENIERLGLHFNSLDTLPESIGLFSNLKSLSLKNNHLKFIPEEITRLKNLEKLYLGGNPGLNWAEVLKFMVDMPELELLDISVTPIPLFDEFRYLSKTGLKKINIMGCSFLVNQRRVLQEMLPNIKIMYR